MFNDKWETVSLIYSGGSPSENTKGYDEGTSNYR